jgi:hypothetical protein
MQVGKELPDLHTRQPEWHFYHMLYWYNWFSWWWERGCSKHVENWNKHIEKNCASSWSFTRNSTVLGIMQWVGTVCREITENIMIAQSIKKLLRTLWSLSPSRNYWEHYDRSVHQAITENIMIAQIIKKLLRTLWSLSPSRNYWEHYDRSDHQVITENIMIAQSIKKFLSLYRTGNFITVTAKAGNWSLLWVARIQ